MNFPTEPVPAVLWQLRTQLLRFEHGPRLMGIINVTPDSFSDGGRFRLAELAVEHALRLADEGAGVLDIGGESTRPYAALVDEQEELRRVIPVIRALAKQTDRPLSIDTSKASVAEQALDAGAEIINDVTGLAGDPRMLDVARRSGAGICVMHMQGTPRDMQDNPVYANVVTDIHDYLRQRRDTLLASGIEPAKICLDPGIGFGKTHDHNLTLLGACRRFHELGQPLLVGHSRKGFIGHLIGDREADRMAGTIGVTLALVEQGVQVIRVHDIAPARDAIRLFRACRGQPTVFPGDPLPG